MLGLIDMYKLLMPQYFAFLIMEVFSCLMVLKALKRPGPGDDVKKRDGMNRDKVKAFWIIQMVLVSLVLTYAPLTISLVLYYILDFKKFLGVVVFLHVYRGHVRICAAFPLSQKS